MAEPQFTPGPWTAEPATHSDGRPTGDWLICTRAWANYIIVDRFNRHTEANARLIAAAPDLYAACKLVLDVRGLNPNLIDEVSAAIRKAEAEGGADG